MGLWVHRRHDRTARTTPSILLARAETTFHTVLMTPPVEPVPSVRPRCVTDRASRLVPPRSAHSARSRRHEYVSRHAHVEFYWYTTVVWSMRFGSQRLGAAGWRGRPNSGTFGFGRTAHSTGGAGAMGVVDGGQ